MSRIDPLENNLIINGHMPLAQRVGDLGSVAGINAGAVKYAADRFFVNVGAGVTGIVSLSHVSSPPPLILSGYATQKASRIDVTTLQASISASHLANFNTTIEGYDIQRLFGKSFLVYFLTRTNKTGLYPYFAANGANDRIYVQGLNLVGDSQWQRHSFLVPAETGGTWTFDEGLGLRTGLTLIGGSDFFVSDGIWNVTGGFNPGLAGNVNFFDSTSNFLEITNMMILPGNFSQNVVDNIQFIPVARNFSDTVNKCQYFFESSWNFDQAVGSTAGPFNVTRFEQSAGGFAMRMPQTWQRKRVPGLFESYSGLTTTIARVNINSVDVPATDKSSNTLGGWVENNTINPSGGASYGYMWTIESEIIAPT